MNNKSIVYFTDFSSSARNNFFDRLNKILKKLEISNLAPKNAIVGIKTHFGEGDNVSVVHPFYIRKIIEFIKPYGWKVFVTDSNTIYVGSRVNAVDHLNLAISHGFSWTTLQVPIIIADGLRGNDYREVEIEGGNFYKKVKVSSAIANSDALIVITHFKGHIVGGFGGALKNLGMGCAPRAQKYDMHANMVPKIKTENCIGCGECMKWCPSGAIKVINKKAVIDPKICIGCGECISACPQRCVKIPWDESPANTQKKWVETAKGVIKSLRSKIFYINFLNNITPECDCMHYSDKHIVSDIGVLFSYDPVAIDMASADLVNKSEWNKGINLDKKNLSDDKFKSLYPEIDWRIQIDYAVSLGIGSKDYELVKI